MKQKIAIVGGGPAGMMLACSLNSEKYEVAIYEKNKALGRKFLVAGKGGFNLTHSSSIEEMKLKYIGSELVLKSLDYFTNKDLINWLKEIGIDTYTGSSGRIFPVKKIKPIRVFNAILTKISNNKVTIHYNHNWIGFNAKNELEFETPEQDIKSIKADIFIFALGGGSWGITGSTGDWSSYFFEKGINLVPFYPSNCGFKVEWKKAFIDEFEGQPLKNIALSFKDETYKGELVLTQFGIEGSPVYALSNSLRKELKKGEFPAISIDLKPTTKSEAIVRKLKEPKKKNSWSEHIIYKLKLSKCVFQLIKRNLTKEAFTEPEEIAKIIKNFPLQLTGIASVEEAISSVGGIPFDEITSEFELKKIPGNYVIGEMLNWDAPTGGYLLQACFSMGAYLGKILNEKPNSF